MNTKNKALYSNSEFYSKCLFILLSLLSMSTIFYSSIGIFYKAATALVFVISLVAAFKNFKQDTGYRTYILATAILITTQVVAALANFHDNLVGNLIEVVFMCAYLWLLLPVNKKNLGKIITFTSYAVQIASFILFLFIMVMVIFRITIIWQPADSLIPTCYGYYNGRLWGFINPNSTAMLAYSSIVLGLVLIHKKDRFSKAIKFNILFQCFNISFQQSRGAMISCIVMIGIYFLFVDKSLSRTAALKRIVTFTLAFVIALIGMNKIVNAYIHLHEGEVIVFGVADDYDVSKIKKNLADEQLDMRLSDSKSSGRLEIWSNGLKMASEKPVFGFGVRNFQPNYERFFEEYTIENSLLGGNFHNIFLTVYVASGLLGLVAFVGLIGYLSLSFLKFLNRNIYKDNSLYIVLFFGLLAGQFFESTVFYSTNFINILFWMLAVYGIGLCNEFDEEESKRIRQITDTKELQDIELGILDYIHEVCEQENIQYFLAYGTLIGAIRHKGFIPWDDDIDICLMRDDYERLKAYLLTHEDERYALKTFENDDSYIYPFMKVIDKHTYLIENGVRKDSHLGVYLDIFPVDGQVEDAEFEKEMSTLIKKSELCSYSFKGIKAKGRHLENLVRYFALIAFSFKDVSAYCRDIDKLAKTRKLDGPFCNFLMYKSIKKPAIRNEWVSETMDWEFCGKNYKIPVGYDQVLRVDYDNYMELPPEEQRVSHHDFIAWKIK